MIIDIYAVGYSIGTKDKKSGCAVILQATYPDGRVQQRRMTFKFGPATMNLAQIKAAWIGMMALRRRSDKVTLHTNSHYVAEMLVKNGDRYKAAPSSNVESVDALRDVFQSIGNVTVEHSKFDDGLGSMCLIMAKKSVHEVPSDSKTVEVPRA